MGCTQLIPAPVEQKSHFANTIDDCICLKTGVTVNAIRRSRVSIICQIVSMCKVIWKYCFGFQLCDWAVVKREGEEKCFFLGNPESVIPL